MGLMTNGSTVQSFRECSNSHLTSDAASSLAIIVTTVSHSCTLRLWKTSLSVRAGAYVRVRVQACTKRRTLSRTGARLHASTIHFFMQCVRAGAHTTCAIGPQMHALNACAYARACECVLRRACVCMHMIQQARPLSP